MALQINSIGSQIADASENYRKRMSNLERRINKAEDDFEVMVEKLMGAPPGSVNTFNLNIRRAMGAGGPAPPSTGPAAPAAPASGPSMPAQPATTAGPGLSAQPAPAAGPNLSAPAAPAAGPNLSAPAAPAAGPNLNAQPTPGGTPNLSAQPAPAAGPPSGGIGADSIANALANLKAAPEQEASASTAGGGITASSIQSALSNLKKAPEKPKEETGFGPFGGFNPAEALKNLKKVPDKDEGADDEDQKSEFASILEKRRKASDETMGAKPKTETDEAPPEPTAEEMKSQLQAKLKSAFKK